jgi:hypothetical protein
MKIDSKQIEFFEFLMSLNKEQLRKYFLMLGPEESEYVRQLAIRIGTQLTLDLNLELAELFDGVEDLDDAKLVLNDFTLSGKVK